MRRKGATAEYEAKRLLVREYGPGKVWKLASGQGGPDFIIFDDDGDAFFLEVKSRKDKCFKPSSHDREQFKNYHSLLRVAPIFYLIKHKPSKKVMWEWKSYGEIRGEMIK